MNIHVFTNESPYSNSFLLLLARQFDIRDHLFLFSKTGKSKFFYPENIKARTIYCGNFKKLAQTFSAAFRNCNRLYFHYLPYGPSLFTWYFSPKLLRKSTWIFWGGDIFAVRDYNRNIFPYMYEKMRKGIIRQIPLIAGLIKEDYEIVKKTYNTKATFMQVFYPYPINFDLLSKVKTKGFQSSEKTILLGNSAAPSNNHLEILLKLKLLNKGNIKIICPLSYGGSNKYARMVEEKGKEIFQDKFVPLSDFIEPAEYSRILAGIDIVIMNHERQQGLGNIFPMLFLEKKVFIRSDAPSFEFMKSIGCTIYDTLLIENEFDNLFVSNAQSLKNNAEIIYNFLSEEHCVSLWKDLFNQR